mgnify:CR=1 FL=1
MTVPSVTQAEFAKRLASFFPVNWAGQDAHTVGVLSDIWAGISQTDYVVHGKLLTVQQQISLLTAVGDQMDNIARDFFGDKFPRNSGESDSAYRTRIVTRLFQPIGTRPGMEDGIETALGTAPTVMEKTEFYQTGAWSDNDDVASGAAYDSGGYMDGSTVCGPFAYDTSGAVLGAGSTISPAHPGAIGYDEAGAYALELGPYQCLIDIQQPEPDDDKFLTYGQIMRLVESLKPLSTICWVKITGPESTDGVPIT